MGGIRGFYGSMVGKKFVMGITGLIGVGFVIVHALGNLLVFRGPDAINSYSRFLKSTGEILWTAPHHSDRRGDSARDRGGSAHSPEPRGPHDWLHEA